MSSLRHGSLISTTKDSMPAFSGIASSPKEALEQLPRVSLFQDILKLAHFTVEVQHQLALHSENTHYDVVMNFHCHISPPVGLRVQHT